MMLANLGPNGEPMETPSICLEKLLLKLNTGLVQASKISFYIMRFRKVVGITLSTYIRFRIILTVLFNGILVNNGVKSKLMNLYSSLNNYGGMAFIRLAASKQFLMK